MNPYNMRAHFGRILQDEMRKNDKIIIIAADLGYVLFDEIKKQFPNRFINCGAAEQLALGIAVGYALEGYIPVVYSISSFLLLRPSEFIRNYLGHEGINVKLAGSGIEDDYKTQGFTHHLFKTKELCDWLEIESYFPNKENLVDNVHDFIYDKNPAFIALRK